MRLRGAVLGVLLVTACSGTTPDSPDPGPRFAYEGGELRCMAHQPRPPGARCTDAELVRTEETMAVLRYYTANGTKPYRDARDPPTSTAGGGPSRAAGRRPRQRHRAARR